MTDETTTDTSQLVGGGAAATGDGAPRSVIGAAARAVRKAAKKRKRAAKPSAAAKPAAAKVVATPTTATGDDGKAAYAAAKLHQVGTFEELPENVDGYHMRFAAHGEFVHGAIAVHPGEVSSAGHGRATYDTEVDFSVEGIGATVTEAWLIAGSGEAVMCDLGVGLRVGGGHHAKIPAKHLLF